MDPSEEEPSARALSPTMWDRVQVVQGPVPLTAVLVPEPPAWVVADGHIAAPASIVLREPTVRHPVQGLTVLLPTAVHLLTAVLLPTVLPRQAALTAAVVLVVAIQAVPLAEAAAVQVAPMGAEAEADKRLFSKSTV